MDQAIVIYDSEDESGVVLSGVLNIFIIYNQVIYILKSWNTVLS